MLVFFSFSFSNKRSQSMAITPILKEKNESASPYPGYYMYVPMSCRSPKFISQNVCLFDGIFPILKISQNNFPNFLKIAQKMPVCHILLVLCVPVMKTIPLRLSKAVLQLNTCQPSPDVVPSLEQTIWLGTWKPRIL